MSTEIRLAEPTDKYVNKMQSVSNARILNSAFGYSAGILSLSAGGPVGWILAATAGSLTIYNNIRLKNLDRENENEYIEAIKKEHEDFFDTVKQAASSGQKKI